MSKKNFLSWGWIILCGVLTFATYLMNSAGSHPTGQIPAPDDAHPARQKRRKRKDQKIPKKPFAHTRPPGKENRVIVCGRKGKNEDGAVSRA